MDTDKLDGGTFAPDSLEKYRKDGVTKIMAYKPWSEERGKMSL